MNKIESIENNSFISFQFILDTLDLSNNLLKEISSETFKGKNDDFLIGRLNLDYNQIEIIEKNSLFSVFAGFSMKSNKIKIIELNAFNDMSQLTSLDLSN